MHWNPPSSVSVMERMKVRRLVRRSLPYRLRLAARIMRRRLADRASRVAFATSRADLGAFPCTVSRYERPFIDYPGQEAFGAAKRHNQALLAAQLSGTIIGPRETFSVWRLAARPSRQLGYAEAAALKEGELTTDVGGAICLLSTVLYNVALLAGLDIAERHCHSVDSYGDRRYFELGRDAAIEYGYRDLRFSNPHPMPLLLEIEVTGDYVRAELRTQAPLQVEVSLLVSEPEHLPPPPPEVVVDESLVPGEEVWVRAPIPGLRVHTSRTTRLAGEERVDELGESLHEPRPGTIRRGPRPGRFR